MYNPPNRKMDSLVRQNEIMERIARVVIALSVISIVYHLFTLAL